MSTLTNEDLTILSDLDFAPPCDHSWHAKRENSALAAWGVLFKPILECGCPPLGLAHLWCDDCKNRVLHSERLTCNTCKAAIANPAADIVLIEALA